MTTSRNVTIEYCYGWNIWRAWKSETHRGTWLTRTVLAYHTDHKVLLQMWPDAELIEVKKNRIRFGNGCTCPFTRPRKMSA